MMKRYVTLVGILCLHVLALVPQASAQGPSAVRNTLHNLSVTAPVDAFFGTAFYATNEDEVCIFCHTPHGGSLNGPLWNHPTPPTAAYFTHYNSATLSTYMKGLPGDRAPSDESLLCLSCHDGSISVNSLHNTSNDVGQPITTNTGTPDTVIAYMFGGGSNLGDGSGNLANDHPISFSYDAVLASPEYDIVTGAKKNSLQLPGAAMGNGIRFFGLSNRVECSSCHDPHVDYINNPQYTPFLITSNAGSALCRACHNK